VLRIEQLGKDPFAAACAAKRPRVPRRGTYAAKRFLYAAERLLCRQCECFGVGIQV